MRHWQGWKRAAREVMIATQNIDDLHERAGRGP
jgi:NAD-dependent SIR2 family protein deacetylase